MEFNFNSYDNSKQAISYCEVDKCKAVIELKQQLEAYKMEAEEGKEINAELKSDNKHLNGLLDQALKELEEHREALEKVREIAKDKLKWCKDNKKFCLNCVVTCRERQILQICDEVNDEK